MSQEQNDDAHHTVYLSYLLRLWWTSSDGKGVWRASLTDALTKKRTGFASLEALFEFLKERTEEVNNNVCEHDLHAD
ncbi:MAG: hypothetical protein JW934_18845 [Anaerolineae bacterium]|nr:hypothetical protein [Anaerolineae bacterium]